MSLLKNIFGNQTRVSFMIVGAQKCGTSSLFHYLSAHPLLQGARNKEAAFFSKDFYYNQGPKVYHELFDNFGKRGIRYFDATPAYINSPVCSQRIFEYNKDMKFILLVRNPIKRAFSAFNMYKMFHSDPESRKYVTSKEFIESIPVENKPFWEELLNSEEGPSFDKFIQKELKVIADGTTTFSGPPLIRAGIYLPQLERYYKFFPKNAFLIFEDKELENDGENVLKQIEKFLDIPPFKWESSKINKKHHVRPYADQMSPETMNMLKEFFRPHNEAFFDHIGRKFDWDK